ncbi:MAG: response regulator transcription factor [Acidimicrobiales bacterium]
MTLVSLALRDVATVSPAAGEAAGEPVPAEVAEAGGGPSTVLVVDGDPSSASELARALELEGFATDVVHEGGRVLARLAERAPALVLLATSLPDQSGMAVFRAIAAVSSVPVIVMAPLDDELDAVLALEAGAADLVTVPVRQRELTARVRAALRRQVAPTAFVSTAVGSVHLDLALREVTVDGQPVDLSRKEFDLLALLLEHPGHVVSRAVCMERLWPSRRHSGSRTLDTHVKRLRKKLEADPARPRYLLTVRGVGYRFRP